MRTAERAGALAVAGLEHPELAALERELHVLHLVIMQLELVADGLELFEDLRHVSGKLRDGLGVADAGHHVLALGVHEVVAIEQRFTGCRIAGEGHARAGALAHVAKDHGLDVDRRSQVVRDAGRIAIVHRTPAVPAAEDGLDGHAQLVQRLLGEGGAGQPAHTGLESLGQALPVLARQLRVVEHAALVLHRLNGILEELVVHVHDNRAVHLYEPAVEVVDEARVAGGLDQAGSRRIVEADVQHGVHHAGHGELGARAAGDQEGFVWITECLAGGLLDRADGLEHLVPEPIGQAFGRQVGVAGACGHAEAGRYGYAGAGHLAQVGAFAAQEGAHRVPVTDSLLGLGYIIEQVYPSLCHELPPWSLRSFRS